MTGDIGKKEKDWILANTPKPISNFPMYFGLFLGLACPALASQYNHNEWLIIFICICMFFGGANIVFWHSELNEYRNKERNENIKKYFQKYPDE